MTGRSALVLVALAAFSSGPLDGQTRRSVRLKVQTIDAITGEPIGGVLVRLSGLEEGFTTDESGALEFDAPLGSYRLTARHPSYDVLRGDFLIRRSGEFTLPLEAIVGGDSSTSGRLTGVVVDAQSARSIAGALISLRGFGDQITNDRGRFVFDDVPRGPTSVDIEMLGYADRSESVTIERGQSTLVRVEMSVDAIELEPIEVEIRSRVLEDRGVYDRMDAGVAGRYVTRHDIEERASQHLGEAFLGTPGVRLRREGHRSLLVGRDNCPLDVYVDGLPVMSEEADGLYNLDMFPPQWVEVAEVYASSATAPSEFARSGSGCGVILIWTRQRD